MKQYIIQDPWRIIEDKFDTHLHPNSESLFSIGNGRMGQRANFEEDYSGQSLRGSYIGGVYYPDKTRVGWWKNGYPEYFAKVLNSVNWIGLHIKINDILLDLNTANVISFNRELDMRTGILKRNSSVKLEDGNIITVNSERFYSLYNQNWAFLNYTISSSQKATIEIESYLDFNIRNSDSNYQEDFWYNRTQNSENEIAQVKATTKKTEFDVSAAMISTCKIENENLTYSEKIVKAGFVSHNYTITAQANQKITLSKAIAIVSSFYKSKDSLDNATIAEVKEAYQYGFLQASKKQKELWAQRWQICDIEIEGDVAAQQGIRFNIFQLYQTYSGEDPRLNIGPKGFTGEKYGGSTYWDTEAYCLPFFQSIAPPSVAHSLLVYRHNHLPKAIINATKLGFTNGAALYPMVTMNGEECHNEWEITFEEIHRNGAIAYAIYDYINYTGDNNYLNTHGLEVLVAISRFWAQRVNWSTAKQQYVMLGVTGPNEYENNVNNNWYTNYIARWCLQYTSACISELSKNSNSDWKRISEITNFNNSELDTWLDIIEKMYLPYDKKLNIFLQQDGFLDKEQLTVADLKKSERPINQKWSWDRILRSIFIKQADVLQGLYFFENDFTVEEHQRNFDFYEPRTVHESSLSPCVHSILAAKLGKTEKAYEMYLRTARLDLDDYNNDTEDGCHITSMAGTWLSIVKGFGGMRSSNDILSFRPFLPPQWTKYSFKVMYRNQLISIEIKKGKSVISNLSESSIAVLCLDKNYTIKANSSINIES